MPLHVLNNAMPSSEVRATLFVISITHSLVSVCIKFIHILITNGNWKIQIQMLRYYSRLFESRAYIASLRRG